MSLDRKHPCHLAGSPKPVGVQLQLSEYRWDGRGLIQPVSQTVVTAFNARTDAVFDLSLEHAGSIFSAVVLCSPTFQISRSVCPSR
jgi:hypothetical protein